MKTLKYLLPQKRKWFGLVLILFPKKKGQTCTIYYLNVVVSVLCVLEMLSRQQEEWVGLT